MKWVSIKGYEGLYEVSDMGSVRSVKNGKILKPHIKYVKGDPNRSLHALGKKYNASWCTIQAIIKGRLWKHLKEGDV